MAGNFFADIAMTRMGGIRHARDTGNSVFITVCIAKIRVASRVPPENLNPQAIKIAQYIKYVGPVVHSIARMWSKISPPDTAGARLVVSESGDILSPK